MTPTKSGVLGLLAAAGGRRRTDDIEDLVRLRFGVRVDQPGQLLRDFQTAIDWETTRAMPLSYRYYIADAAFLAGVEGDQGLLESVAAHVRQPHFSLYLGRRSCPVTDPVFLGLTDKPLEEALRSHPWLASAWHRRRARATVNLDLVVDAEPDDRDPTETRRDVPMSFNPERREYGWRDIAHRAPVVVENPDHRGSTRSTGTPDWFITVQES